MSGRRLFCFTLAFLLAGPALAQHALPDDVEIVRETLPIGNDRTARMTVPVRIDGAGPYSFVVDTGAERTVISDELARSLELREGRSARVHSMSGVSDISTVVIPSLRTGGRTVRDLSAPALARADLGADGLLGIDALQSQQVLFDFEKQVMIVRPASSNEEEKWDRDTIVVRAKSKFGRLILADARVDGEKVWVVLDTGSQVSIGNEALRSKLLRKRKLGAVTPIDIVSVTGGKFQADYARVKDLAIGGVKLVDMPLAFADAHPFHKLGLTKRPALLLGMDALRAFDRVSVDFANRKVRFDMPALSGLTREVRLAFLSPAETVIGE